MNYRNLIPKLTVALVGFAVAYVVVRTTQVRPWTDDFGDRIDWDVVVVQFLPTVSFMANLVLAVYRSVKSRDYAWTVVVLVLFPLGLWYTLFVNNGADSHSPSKPKSLRGSA